ncbi:MAG: DNA recombination protein RmuC [Deltaproteobacteria bacterium]|nr:MAG: DNA recombination protein RmuC [Deltaproteobacteria bacterium]
MVTQAGLVVVLAILVLAIAVAVLVAARRGGALGLVQQQLEALRTQVGQALGGQAELLGQEIGRLTAQLNERLRESGELVQRSQTSVGERLDHTARVVGEVQQGLGELREATARVRDIGRDVVSLHDILRAPKLRGGLGELLLGDLLAQVLPARHFTLQHTFQNGERVDAVVRLGPALVPVDAKFPLEDFRRLLEAGDDETRTRARRAFVARVRKHIDDVATKYILPDEGTYDFALMYVPAENVYYEAIVRDDGGNDRELSAYALERKVIPVSPNCFYAYLQAIVLGLRGLRIEARAQEVVGQLARLAGDLGRLQDDFRVLGRHVTNAAQAHAAADRRLDRLTAKLAEIAADENAEEPEQQPLLRAQ